MPSLLESELSTTSNATGMCAIEMNSYAVTLPGSWSYLRWLVIGFARFMISFPEIDGQHADAFERAPFVQQRMQSQALPSWNVGSWLGYVLSAFCQHCGSFFIHTIVFFNYYILPRSN